MLGVVLYAGMESKKWLNYKSKLKNKPPKLEKTINFIMLVNLGVMAGYVLVCSLLGYYNKNSLITDSFADLVINHIFLFHNLVPISFYLSFKISKILQAMVINRQSPEIQIKDPRVLSDLGKIEYIVTEKTGIITDEDLKIQFHIIKDLIYSCDEDCTQSIKLENFQFDSDLHLNASENHALTVQTIHHLKNRLTEDFSSEVWYYFLAAILCNHVIPFSEMRCINKYEKVLKDSITKFGISLERRDLISCEIGFNEEIFGYNILYSQKNDSKNTTVRLFIQNIETDEVILLYKGNYKDIAVLISEEDFAILNESLAHESLNNLTKVAFGYKILDKEEVSMLEFDMQNANWSPLNNEGRVEAVFSKYEKKLVYLGMIAIENPVSAETKQSIKSLTDAGIKI